MGRTLRFPFITAAFVALAVLSGCGSSEKTASTPEPTTTTADVTTTVPTSSTTASPITTVTAAPPSAPSNDCGPVQTVEPNQKIVLVRAVDCATAKRVLKQWDDFKAGNGAAPQDGWGCYMGRIGDGYTLVCATEFPAGTSAREKGKNAFIVVNQ